MTRITKVLFDNDYFVMESKTNFCLINNETKLFGLVNMYDDQDDDR